MNEPYSLHTEQAVPPTQKLSVGRLFCLCFYHREKQSAKSFIKSTQRNLHKTLDSAKIKVYIIIVGTKDIRVLSER